MTRPLLCRFVAPVLLALGSFAGARLAGAAAVPAAAVAPAVLEWKATKEEGVYGYLVYRATDREGPYRRLGREIVHVARQPRIVGSICR